MKKNCLLWLLVAAMAMTSCQDEFIKNENKTSDKIGYSVNMTELSSPYRTRSGEIASSHEVEIDDVNGKIDGKQVFLHTITDMVVPMDIKQIKGKNQPQSRAAEKTVADVDEIGVTSVVWNGDSWAAASDHRVYMDNVLAESTAFQTNYYWPAAEEYIRFFAIHPYTDGPKIIADDKKNPKIQWTVPEDVTKQHDILVASNNYAGDHKATANLNFAHALTAVQFKLASGLAGVKVTAVRIKGVYYQGTYTYNFDNCTTKIVDDKTYYLDGGEWEVVMADDKKRDFATTGPADASTEDEMLINGGDKTFMMMPQTLPDGATIEVDITDAHGSETLTASLKDKVWNKGTKVTYVLTFNGKDIVVSVGGIPDWSGAGGTINAGF